MKEGKRREKKTNYLQHERTNEWNQNDGLNEEESERVSVSAITSLEKIFALLAFSQETRCKLENIATEITGLNSNAFA